MIGYKDLHKAARSGDEELILLIMERGADVNTKDQHGYTPLDYSAQANQPRMMRLLIDQGAEVQSPSGNTPLHYAVMSGALECVKVLLAAKANPNAVKTDGNTPLILASALLENDDGILPFPSTFWGRIDDPEKLKLFRSARPASCAVLIVEELLKLCAQVNVNGWRGFSPLHAAAMANNIEVLQRLIANGADMAVLDGSGESARGRAIEIGWQDAASFLP